jgi:hypothetical protein
MENSTVTSLIIIGMAGVAGYFFYEYYIKKSTPSAPAGLNTSGIFENANNTVNSFLSSISGAGSNLLNSSGLLNKQGINEANSIMNNPLQFNDLMMQSSLNSLLNGNTGSSSGAISSSQSNSAYPVFAPYVTPGTSADLLVGGLT